MNHRVNNDAIHIAVFGDTHGHIRLMLQLCRLWQMHHQVKLDGVLQCGDFGFFPDQSKLDRATNRYARKDPEELGFRWFSKPEPAEQDDQLAELLTGAPEWMETVSCPVYFCHGNHEDFDALNALSRESDAPTVDCFDRIHWLQSGSVINIGHASICGLGGGPENPTADSAMEQGYAALPWVDDEGSRRAENSTFDILISHCCAEGIAAPIGQFGSRRLHRVVDKVQPAYHFFAHHGNPVEPGMMGNTAHFWLNDVNFVRQRNSPRRPLEPGCMGILRWQDEDNHEFHVVEDEWLDEVNSVNWWNSCWLGRWRKKIEG